MKSRPVPILVGAAQFTQSKDTFSSLDPLGLMIMASRDAFADAGSDHLPAIIDTVCVVNSFSRDDENTPHMLAKSLGVKPRDAIYSLIGGNTPQKLVNQFLVILQPAGEELF
jgi:acetyl-CoA C-acetyltransferase